MLWYIYIFGNIVSALLIVLNPHMDQVLTADSNVVHCPLSLSKLPVFFCSEEMQSGRDGQPATS